MTARRKAPSSSFPRIAGSADHYVADMLQPPRLGNVAQRFPSQAYTLHPQHLNTARPTAQDFRRHGRGCIKRYVHELQPADTGAIYLDERLRLARHIIERAVLEADGRIAQGRVAVAARGMAVDEDGGIIHAGEVAMRERQVADVGVQGPADAHRIGTGIPSAAAAQDYIVGVRC